MKVIQKIVSTVFLIAHFTVLSSSCDKVAPDEREREENIKVDGHNLNIRIRSSATTTIIFLSGLESSCQIYGQTQNALIDSIKIPAYEQSTKRPYHWR